jgi:hypothetical protein
MLYPHLRAGKWAQVDNSLLFAPTLVYPIPT